MIKDDNKYTYKDKIEEEAKDKLIPDSSKLEQLKRNTGELGGATNLALAGAAASKTPIRTNEVQNRENDIMYGDSAVGIEEAKKRNPETWEEDIEKNRAERERQLTRNHLANYINTKGQELLATPEAQEHLSKFTDPKQKRQALLSFISENFKRDDSYAKMQEDISYANLSGEEREAKAKESAQESVASQLPSLRSSIEKQLETTREKEGQKQVDKVQNILDSEKNPIRRGLALSAHISTQPGTIHPETDALNTALKYVQDSERIMREHNDPNKDSFSGKMKSAWRGFKDKAFSIDNWTFGVTEAIDQQRVADISKRFEAGEEITDSEAKLMDALALNLATNLYYDEGNRGYTWGSIPAESLPFMLEFMLNPVTGVGNAVAKNVAKYGVKKFGSKVAQKGMQYAGRLAGDLVTSALMTATTGSVRTITDVEKRMQGEHSFDFNAETGDIEYAGREGQGDGLITAMAKGIGSQFIEYQSEMFGERLGAIGEVAGATKLGANISRKYSASAFGKVAGRMGNSSIAKNIKALEKRAQWSGVIEEWIEEQQGTFMNALFIGDAKMADLVDKDQQIDTFMGLLLSGGVMSGLQTSGYATDRLKTGHKLNKLDNMMPEYLSNWEELKGQISEMNVDDRISAIKELSERNDLSLGARQNLVDYISTLSYNDAMKSSFEESVSEDSRIASEKATDMFYTYLSDKRASLLHQYSNQMNELGNLIPNLVGLEASEVDELIASEQIDSQDLENYRKYNNLKSLNDGIVQSLREEVDKAIEPGLKYYQDNIHEDGETIVQVNLGSEEQPDWRFVNRGNIAFNEDGSIDRISSSNMLYSKNEEGRTEQISLSRVHQATSSRYIDVEEEIKEEKYKQIIDPLAKKIDGETIRNVGDELEYISNKGNPQKGQVIDVGEHTVTIATPDGKHEVMTKNQLDNSELTPTTEDGLRIRDEITVYIDGIEHKAYIDDIKTDGTTTIGVLDFTNPKHMFMTLSKEELNNMRQPQAPTDALSQAEIAESEISNSNEKDTKSDESVSSGLEETKQIESKTEEIVSNSDIEETKQELKDTEDDVEETEEARAEREYQEFEQSLPRYKSGAQQGEINESLMTPQQTTRYFERNFGKESTINAVQAQVRKLKDDKRKQQDKVKKNPLSIKENTKLQNIENQIKEFEGYLQDNLTENIEEREKQKENAKAIQERIDAREELREQDKQREHGQVGDNIKERWNNSAKVEGSKDTIALPNGEMIAGSYYLVPADAPTPSHNAEAGYSKSEGFPLTEDGSTVNDRDYEKDTMAQTQNQQRANNFDMRAVQTPVVVSKDGVVLSGNDRTMASQQAARQGTDKAYNDYIREQANKWGFTQEQIDAMPNARVVFVPDADMPYDTNTFKKFNAEDKKSQSNIEQAVKASKTISIESILPIANIIDKFDRLSDMYQDAKATKEILDILQRNGILMQNEVARMVETNGLFSQEGRSYLETLLLGGVLNEKSLREIDSMKSVRQTLVRSLPQIMRNLALNDYSLATELNNSIHLLYEAKQAGNTVKLHLSQTKLFEDSAADMYDNIAKSLAMMLDGEKDIAIRNMLDEYNKRAADIEAGLVDMFDGTLAKPDLLNKIIEAYGKEETDTTDDTTEQSKQGREEREDASVEQTGATPQLDEESKREKPAERGLGQRHIALISAIQKLSTQFNIPVKVHSSISTVTNKRVLREIEKGERVKGWYDVKSGEAHIYLPNAESIEDVQATFLHEALGHKALRDVLGKEKHDQLLEDVFDALPKEAQDKLLKEYNGNKKIAVDEFIAEVAQKGEFMDVPKKNLIQIIIDAIKNLFVDIKIETSAAEILANQALNDAMVRMQEKRDAINDKIEDAAKDVDTNPTEAQKEAGNYKKGHVKVGGFDITIENPAGSERSGTDESGKPWSITMNNHYGYFKLTKAVDGDHVDVFIGNNPNSEKVFVIDQVNPDTKQFDENKVMLGFDTAEQAREAYLSNYEEGWQGMGTMTEVDIETFRDWLYRGTKQQKPFSQYKAIHEEGATVSSIEQKKTETQRKPGESIADYARRVTELNSRFRKVEKQQHLDKLNAELRQSERNLDKLKKEHGKAYRRYNELSNKVKNDPSLGMAGQGLLLEAEPAGASMLDFGNADEALSEARSVVRDAKAKADELGRKVNEASKDVERKKEEIVNTTFNQQLLFRKQVSEINQVKNGLVALHNISENNLLHTTKTGMLPMPSIAVTKADIPFTGFGEITLIGGKGLIDPQADRRNKVWSADAYTVRYPNVRRTVGKEKALIKYSSKLPAEIARQAVHDIAHSIESGGLSELMEDRNVQYQFLKENGNDVTAYKEAPHNEVITELIRGHDAYDWCLLSDKESLRKELTPLYIQELADKGMKDDGRLKDLYLAEDGLIDERFAENTYNSTRRYIRDIDRGDKIDTYTTLRNAREKIYKNGEFIEGYQEYVKDLYESLGVQEKIFNGYTPSGNPRLIANTPENALKIMLKERGAAKENASGVGKIVASESKTFKSTDQMKEHSENIKGREAHEEAREQLNGKFLELSNTISDKYKGNNVFNQLDDLIDEMGDIARKGQSQMYNKVSPEAQALAQEIIAMAKNAPVQYFEGKPERMVYMSEFAVAIIPHYTSNETKQALEQAGISFREYSDNESRVEAVKKASEDMGLRFRKTYTEIADIKEKAIADGTFMKAPNGKDTNLTEHQWLQTRTKAFKEWFGDWENDPKNASKVIDENGEPMVMYHGTEAEFNVFERYGVRIPALGLGYYFTYRMEKAGDYGSNIKAVFLNARDLLDWGKLTSEQRQEVENAISEVIPEDRKNYGEIKTEKLSKKELETNIDQVLEKVEFARRNRGDIFPTKDGDYEIRWREPGIQGANYAQLLNLAQEFSNNIGRTLGKDGVTYKDETVVFESNQIKSATGNDGSFDASNDDIRFRNAEKQLQLYFEEEIKSNISNSNTKFVEDENTKYYTDSKGEKIPFKAFNPNENRNRDNLLQWESDKSIARTDFALVERQFTEYKQLNFTAGQKIESQNDVAWLFRNLEDEAVEHSFVVYIKEDGSYITQHVGTGGVASTIVDSRLFAGNAVKLGASSIVFVHNHPSGQLKSSPQDKIVQGRLVKAMEGTGVNVLPGIVINLRSGKYLQFESDTQSDIIKDIEEQNQDQKDVQVLSFSKQVFVENYNPSAIRSPDDIAAFVNSKKFGVSDKTELLVLNNQNEIVGKFILPEGDQYPRILELLSQYGGTSAVLYGNKEFTPEHKSNTRKLEKQLKDANFGLLDVLNIKSDNYESMANEGYIGELGAEYSKSYKQNDVRFRKGEQLFSNPSSINESVGDYNKFLSDVFNNSSQKSEILKDARQSGMQLDKSIENYIANEATYEEVESIAKDLGIDIPVNAVRYMFWQKANPDDGSVVWKAKDAVKYHELKDNILFRKGGPVRKSALREYESTIRSKRNNGLKGFMYGMEEGWFDRMISLKILQDSILQGKDMKEGMNAYLLENQLSSKNTAEIESYQKKYLDPMIKIASKIFGKDLKAIDRYLMAKHGFERNAHMAKEQAKANGQKKRDEYKKQLDADKITEDEYNELMDKQDVIDAKNAANLEKTKDYSGLTQLYEELTGEEASYGEEEREFLNKYVSDIETKAGKEDIKELWNSIKQATQYMIRKQFDSGMMSKENFDIIMSMYEYYVPLRGFEDTVATDIYEYLLNKPSDFNKVLMKAKGRTSMADSPFASILNMAESGIMQANRNNMKKAFYRLVATNPSNYASIKDAWYIEAADDKWIETHPDIPLDATGEEVKQIVDEFEAEMQALEATGGARRGRNKLDVGVRIGKSQASEHAVNVWVNGEEKIIYVNGNPRAAQAINGLTNSSTKERGDLLRTAQFWMRQMSANFTSRNPAFMVTNAMRDWQFAVSSAAIKHGGRYAMKLAQNTAIVGKTVAQNIWSDGNKNNAKFQQYWNEFTQHGGETGYAIIHSMDINRKYVNKKLREFSNTTDLLTPFRAYAEQAGNANRLVEANTRFASYVTSRQFGKSIEESVNDSKDITINFNRKGSGGFGADIVHGLFLFANPALQSMRQMGLMAKNHPIRFSTAIAMTTAAGYLIPLLNEMMIEMSGGGDDEDMYFNISDWTRRNHIVMYAPWTKNRFITLSLPHELRGFYGLGEMAYSAANGKMRGKNIPIEALKQFGNNLPIDPTGGKSTLAPDVIKPFYEAYVTNENFMGTPIYKDSPWNKHAPEWTKAYKRTSPILVSASRWLNEATGGDDVIKGALDINPAKIQHVAGGYVGGAWTTYSDMVDVIWTAITGEKEDLSLNNVPIANKIVRTSDQMNRDLRTNNEYFYWLDWKDKFDNKYKGYQKWLYKKENHESGNLDKYKGKLINTARDQTDMTIYQMINLYSKMIKETADAGAEEQEMKLKKELVDKLWELDKNRKKSSGVN